MERVGWHPVGMYDKRRAKSATFCYTLITIALLAGTAAVVVSWLLATGVIDPDKRQNFKEARRLDVFRDLNSLEADIKKVSFPSKPSVNVTNPLTASEMPEKMELDISDPGTESNTENIIAVNKESENKAVTEATTDIEEIEKAILKKIETEVLINPETIINSFQKSVDETNTETNQSITTTQKSVDEVDDVETTSESLIINQEVTEMSSTTVIKETKEEETEKEDSTEPFTVPTLTTIEAEAEEDEETIPAVTLVDILSGTLETTTFMEISEVKTTTAE